LKSVLKYGKKQFAIDENRRDTYEHSMDSGHGPSVLATFEGELKQLMAVCLDFLFISWNERPKEGGGGGGKDGGGGAFIREK
jgi:hypothetical protein